MSREGSLQFHQAAGEIAGGVRRDATVQFVLNDEDVTLHGVDLLAPLANTIREHANLKGTKVSCGQGNCGACSVAIEFPHDSHTGADKLVVNSCLFPTGGLVVPSGKVRVITVEGINKPSEDPGRTRARKAGKAIAECNGSQCGFCTPGMVMKAAFHAMNPNASSDVEDIEDLLDGNLCRCTGYRPILYALKTQFAAKDDPRVAEEVAETPANVVRGDGDEDEGQYGHYGKTYASGALKHKNVFRPAPTQSMDSEGQHAVVIHASSRGQKKHRTSEENTDAAPAIANGNDNQPEAEAQQQHADPTVTDAAIEKKDATPQVVAATTSCSTAATSLVDARRRRSSAAAPAARAKLQSVPLDTGSWESAASVNDVLGLLARHGPCAKLVAGNVSSAWSRLFNEPTDTIFVSIKNVAELHAKPSITDDVATFSPLTTLSELLAFFQSLDQKRYAVQSVIEYVKTIANIQVRNLGTIAGNVIAAMRRKGILHSDIGVLFSTMRGTMKVGAMVYGMLQTREVSMQQFLTLAEGGLPAEFIDKWLCLELRLQLPLAGHGDVVRFARTSCRAYGNFPTLCSCGFQHYQSGSSSSGEDGGAAIFFTGPHWQDRKSLALVQGKINCRHPRDPKRALVHASSAVRAAYAGVSEAEQRLIVQMSARVLGIDARDDEPMATAQSAERRLEGQQGKQVYFVDPEQSPITEPMVKEAAYEHYTGKAHYVQDVPPPRGTLNGSPITTPSAIVSFDPALLRQLILEMLCDPLVYVGHAEDVLVLTATDLPYDPASDAVVPHVFGAERDNMFTRRNVLIDDHEYGTKGEIGNNAANKLQPGSFGEFVLAPGFTTFAGQPIAMIVHPDETMSRHLAHTVQARLNRYFDAADPLYHNVEVFDANGVDAQLCDRTKELAVQNINDSRACKKLLTNWSGPADRQPTGYPQVQARGHQSTFATDDPHGANPDSYDAMWAAWKADPNVTVVEHMDQRNPIVANRQAHMYMETQTAICRREEGRYYVDASTQNCGDVQSRICSLLQVAPRDVVVSNHRICGGFGGKTMQSANIAALAALGNVATGRPVRVALDRQVDFDVIGKRHEFHGRYRVAVDTKTQKFLGMELLYDGDAGCSSDVSRFVLERANISAQNMYDIPEFRSSAYCWLTHKQTGTAMRSFGVIQGATITETAVDHAQHQLVADRAELGLGPAMDPQTFRRWNFYDKFVPTPEQPQPPQYDPTLWTDDKKYPNPAVYYPKTPMSLTLGFTGEISFDQQYGQELLETDNMDRPLTGAWAMATGAEYQKALRECDEFNRKNTFRKRAVSCTPLLYGGGYEVWFLMQQVASVAVSWGGGAVGGAPSGVGYVLVNHSGVEMGQGLQMLIHQSTAKALNVPMGIVRPGKVSTDHTPNQIGTEASTGTHLNVPAVVEACTSLRRLLEAMEDTVIYEEGVKRANDASTGFKMEWLDETYNPTTRRFDDVKTDAEAPSEAWVKIREHFLASPIPDGFPSTRHTNYYLFNYRSWAMPTDKDSCLLPDTLELLKKCCADDSAAIASWIPSLGATDPGFIWGQVCTLAFFLRVPLFATGISKAEADGSEMAQPRPSDSHNWFSFYTYACAWSQVEVDAVTGEIDTLRTEIFYDAGGSINPAADVGQVEGALVQGLGNVFTEEHEYDFDTGLDGYAEEAPSEHPTGRLTQRSIMEYAIPAHRTVPRRLGVNLTWVEGPLRDSNGAVREVADQRSATVRSKAVGSASENRHRAKTTGEPPFVLCLSAVGATRVAIAELRRSLQVPEAVPGSFVQLSTPLTPKRVIRYIWGNTSIVDFIRRTSDGTMLRSANEQPFVEAATGGTIKSVSSDSEKPPDELGSRPHEITPGSQGYHHDNDSLNVSFQSQYVSDKEDVHASTIFEKPTIETSIVDAVSSQKLFFHVEVLRAHLDATQNQES